MESTTSPRWMRALCGGSTRRDVGDEYSVRRRQAQRLREIRVDVLDRHAEVAPRDAPVRDQTCHDGLGHVARDGEADTHVPAASRKNGRRDAEQLSFEVHEGAAGVARVDGGVRLDEILVSSNTEIRTTLGGYDAHRHGFANS